MTSRTHTPEDMQKIMESWRDSASDYERGFIDGMQKQMQSSVDKAVNAMTQPTYYIPNKDDRLWVGLTDEEIKAFDTWHDNREEEVGWCNPSEIVAYIEAKLKEKNT